MTEIVKNSIINVFLNINALFISFQQTCGKVYNNCGILCGKGVYNCLEILLLNVDFYSDLRGHSNKNSPKCQDPPISFCEDIAFSTYKLINTIVPLDKQWRRQYNLIN
jgi:hypothetical protein